MQKLIRMIVGFVALGTVTFGVSALTAEKSAAGDPMANATKVAPATPTEVPVEKVKPVATKDAQPAMPAKDMAAGKSEKTEHNFEDLLVQGKYHFSDEAVTTVEEDKVLDSLLGVRTDFKDKIEQSVGRY